MLPVMKTIRFLVLIALMQLITSHLPAEAQLGEHDLPQKLAIENTSVLTAFLNNQINSHYIFAKATVQDSYIFVMPSKERLAKIVTEYAEPKLELESWMMNPTGSEWQASEIEEEDLKMESWMTSPKGWISK